VLFTAKTLPDKVGFTDKNVLDVARFKQLTGLDDVTIAL
jgi:hypothetical protein